MKVKAAVADAVKVGVWVGVSAGLTYVLTALLDKPELVPWYGVLNIGLVLLKGLKK